jgi:hypothetical protein
VSSAAIIKSRTGILVIQERKEYSNSGAGLAAIFHDYLASSRRAEAFV